MAGMNEILNIDRLPPLPATLAQLLPLLLDPDAPWEKIEQTARRDEAITAAILRLANSAMYGSPGKQHDLKRAMVRLGRDTLRKCILRQQVSGTLSGDNAAFGLQRGALWRSALGGAIAAEDLARTRGLEEPALCFVCALLRDVGKLALNVSYGGRYLDVVATHAKENLSFVEAERAAIGFDHAAVGGALARKWKLPERVARAIETHHEPPEGKEHDVLFDVVHAADVIARWAGLGVGIDGLQYRLANHVRDSLKLDRRSAEREIVTVWTQLRDAEDALGETTNQGAVA